jgi:hypothetical protein
MSRTPRAPVQGEEVVVMEDGWRERDLVVVVRVEKCRKMMKGLRHK